MIDFFNMFKVLQSFVLLLWKYSPSSSWARPSWVTGSGCMWEGLLPCSAPQAMTWLDSELFAWLVWNSAIPKAPLHKSHWGQGGIVVIVSLTVENHGIQHVFWLTILFHGSAVHAIRLSSLWITSTGAVLFLKGLYIVLKNTYPSFNLEVSQRIWK